METIDLSDFFKTRQQANDFSTRLATVFDHMYQTTFDLEKTLMDQFGIARKDKFMTLLRDNNVTTDVPTLKVFLTKVQEIIKTLPVVPIVLAFEPKSQTLQALVDWFQMNVKKQVLFDISVDPKLIGGAAITFNGKFGDYSIKPLFEKIMATTLATPTQNQPAPVAPAATHQHLEDMHLGR
jgi:F0F1-type ATP synthase delta subunit